MTDEELKVLEFKNKSVGRKRERRDTAAKQLSNMIIRADCRWRDAVGAEGASITIEAQEWAVMVHAAMKCNYGNEP